MMQSENNSDGFYCVSCGSPLKLTEAVFACEKCGGAFCKQCTSSTPLPKHNCIESGDGEIPVYDCDC